MWTDDIFDDIDWKLHRQSIKGLQPGHKLQISKFINEWAHTWYLLSQADNSIDSRCFACGTFNETSLHVL